MIKNCLTTLMVVLGMTFSMSSYSAEYGPVASQETLWDIASRNRPSFEVTTQQMMLAIRRANPEAFHSDNINSLKAGSILQLPSISEIDQLNKTEALRSAQQQNSDWSGSNETAVAATTKVASGESASSKASRYKQHYQASQRELKKLQKRLKREQRKRRKLQNELDGLIDGDGGSGSSELPSNVVALQTKVKDLEQLVKQKDTHIAQLENMKTIASETIKRQQETNETLFNKLKKVAPNEVLDGNAASGTLQLEGIDGLVGAGDATVANKSANDTAQAIVGDAATAAGATGQKVSASGGAGLNRDKIFLVAIAVLSLLFAIALLWRAFTHHQARKSIEKKEKEDAESAFLSDEDEKEYLDRKDPVLGT